MKTNGALSDLRVIEYGNMVSGPFCARLLADSGAQVIKIESQSGDDSRFRGPYQDDIQDPEWSALFLYLNSNKRGMTLDLENESGTQIFHDLLKQADILVVNHPVSTIERLRLRYDHLKSINDKLIVTLITPFGLTGPYSSYLGDDIIALASGGHMYSTPGLPDMIRDPLNEPPLRPNTYLGEFVSGLHATNGTMAALFRRMTTDQGCEVDVSQQEAVAMVLGWELAHASYLEPKEREPKVFGSMPNAYMRCKDGYAVIVGFMNRHFVKLAALIGIPELADMEVFSDQYERARNWDALEPIIQEWSYNHTGEEIASMAQSVGVPCFPAYKIGQMADSEHVRERNYMWTYVNQDGRHVRMPGNPLRLGATPPRLRQLAPRLGEHTVDILKEIGYSVEYINRLQQAQVI